MISSPFTIACLLSVLAFPLVASAKYISIDTGECGGDVSATKTVVKSEMYGSRAKNFRAYGVIAYWRSEDDAKKHQCHVEYRLYISAHGGEFSLVNSRTWQTEHGEIAGIDLIGESPDGSKFAADTWIAEGDSEGHWPIVYDTVKKQGWNRSLADKIQVRIHGCDQNEDFVGVSNTGEAIFAIPPSEYDDSAKYGDKGLWHFNLQTGRVYRVRRISGEKW
jgi:hypothetical protein